MQHDLESGVVESELVILPEWADCKPLFPESPFAMNMGSELHHELREVCVVIQQ